MFVYTGFTTKLLACNIWLQNLKWVGETILMGGSPKCDTVCLTEG